MRAESPYRSARRARRGLSMRRFATLAVLTLSLLPLAPAASLGASPDAALAARIGDVGALLGFDLDAGAAIAQARVPSATALALGAVLGQLGECIVLTQSVPAAAFEPGYVGSAPWAADVDACALATSAALDGLAAAMQVEAGSSPLDVWPVLRYEPGD